MMNIDEISRELDNISVADSKLCTPDECIKVAKPSEHNLRIIHINIRSINKNFEQFMIMLTLTKLEFDLLIFTECWLQVAGNLPILNGYDSYFTKSNPIKNDGVVIYIKNSINCTTYEPKILDANSLICCFNKTAIIAVYRSPSYLDPNNFYASLHEIVTTLESYNSVILIGDINIDIKTGNSDRLAQDYLNLTSTLGLLPAHTIPTRISNCLDHVMLRTKTPATVIVIDTYVTDHLPVVLLLSLRKTAASPTTRKSLRYDYDAIKKALDNFDFNHIFSMLDPNLATDTFISDIHSVLNEFSKTIIIPNRKTIIKPWMTAGLLRCLRNRDKMHRKAKKNPDNLTLKITYSRYRNFYNSLIKKLKRAYEKAEFTKAKNNPKATWKVIKHITHSHQQRHSPNALLKSSENPTTSVNNVNDFFINVGRNLASKILHNQPVYIDPYQNLSPSPVNSLVIPPVDETQVKSLILNLRNDCAMGWDNISDKVLKLSCDTLSSVIAHIFNCAIDSGIFPRAFKRAIVHPIYKSGAKDDVSNYRPISVLSSLSKIFERILNKNLTNFMTKNNLIAKNQYGFRSCVSTEDAVIDFVNTLVNKIDNRLKCYGVFLDLTKAFDTVSIPKLVSKMELMGIRGVILNIFKDYLSDRSQCVKIDSFTSSEQFTCYGIPQGSILGPTLFQIYINDLCLLSLDNCDIFCYADDTALLIYDKDWTTAKKSAETSLEHVMKWLTLNLLTLNVTKTKVIQFLPPKTSKSSSVPNNLIAHTCQIAHGCNCRELDMVSTIKYLGVNIDEKLDWRMHTDAVCGRLRKLVYLFRELRYSADQKTASMVYCSLGESIITYCIPVWGGTFKTVMLQVERAQRAVLKVMSFRKRDYPTVQLYSDTQVLTVRQLYILRTVLRRHSTIPSDVTPTSSIRRTGFFIYRPIRCRSALAQRHFFAQSLYLYNKINRKLSIHNLTLNKVKLSLKQWLQTLTYDETENILTRIS